MAFSKLFSRRRRYDDLSVSIQEHLAERADDLTGEGMSRAEAEQQARREFGNVALLEQHSREAWQWPTLESILADIQFSIRQLLKSPGFTTTAVLTLALGIAINATMFSMVSAFLMPHLPGRDPQRVVALSSVNPDGTFQADVYPVSVPNYLQWKKETRLFSAVAATREIGSGGLSTPGETPQAVSIAAVSPDSFDVFGSSPELGRAFNPQEDEAGHNHVLLLSHGLWERRFGADPAIAGKTVRLNREDYLVVGVMPADFRLLGFVPDLWIPLTLTSADRAAAARKDRSLHVFARLQPGVTLEQVRARLNVLAQQAQHDDPAVEQGWGASVRSLGDFLVYNFGIGTALSVVMTVVAFVLLIACTNVAGLLLTRAVGRQRELAIRMSLGASRARVVRQLLTEGVVLALLGGGVGLLLSWFGIKVLRAGMTFNEAISAVPLRLDHRVLTFVAVISAVSALLSSIAPALKASRATINTDLKNDTRSATSSRSHGRLRAVLVGGQIVLAMFLLAGTGHLIRGVYEFDHQDLGFAHDHLLTAGIALDHARYSGITQQKDFVRDLLFELQQIPGVKQVTIASTLPATWTDEVSIHVRGNDNARANQQQRAGDRVITPEYFNAIGVRMLRGRGFTDGDTANSPPVVVVNQQFVHKYLHDGDALGKQVKLDTAGAPEWRQIVGVAPDVKTYATIALVDPEVYEPYAQVQRPIGSFSLMLRTSVNPDSLSGSLRDTLKRLDPELPLVDVVSMDKVIAKQTAGNPLFCDLLATFALLALLLSAIGIYGLIAYSVTERTHEIGIRMALGASTSDVSRMVLRQGFKIAAIGSAIGLLLALPLPRVFGAMFQGLTFRAPEVYPIVLLLTFLVVLVAVLGPAWRASRVDPTTALRIE
jgi:predicted permease